VKENNMEVRWMENGQTCTLSRRKFFTFRVQEFIYFLSLSEMIYSNFLVNVKQLF
jgi:hypothetical protein